MTQGQAKVLEVQEKDKTSGLGYTLQNFLKARKGSHTAIQLFLFCFVLHFLKQNTKHYKGAGRVAQAVYCLPSKHEALSSNPCITTQTNKKHY
jgi:hypothetical protein